MTVRTLHHYDAIGLPNPSLHTEGGYLLYRAVDIARRKLVSAKMPLRGTQDDENGAGLGYDEPDPGMGLRSL